MSSDIVQTERTETGAGSEITPITIGAFTLTVNGLQVHGRPTFDDYRGAGDFIRRVHKASGWWLADWIAYGDSRPEWKALIDAELGVDQLAEQTVREYRYVAKAIPPSSRLDGVSFTLHQATASLDPDTRQALLSRARDEGWTLQEMRREVRACSRRTVVSGQAELKGRYRVIYADPPWHYGNSQPSTSNAARHYPTLTIEALCALPIAAHATLDAVLFLWVTAPMLYENPGPREVIEAWGFKPKTGMVWDKVQHNFGHYVSVRHEHLLIATRGRCTPDRPTPMPDSVFTERRSEIHSAKPTAIRKVIEGLYNGPYLELFGREPVKNWTVFGNDPKLWNQESAYPTAKAKAEAVLDGELDVVPF